MARKKKMMVRPEATVAAAPSGSKQMGDDEGTIQNLKTLNNRLLLEIKRLRSELASSVARSGAELQQANGQLEAERAAASEAMEKLVLKVDEKNLKTAEAAGLKWQLEELVKKKDEILLKYNKIKLDLGDLAAENGHVKQELKAKDAKIKELGQELELIQFQENRRGKWIWLIPLTTVVVAAGALAYATR